MDSSTIVLSPVVELSPGIFINRATEGQVWLGVPFGTDGFVAAELARQMVEHDQRQRGIAAYASYNGDCVSHAGVRLSRSLALTALKFSANARDVHFLRSLGRRAVGDAVALHDTAVLNTLAVCLGRQHLRCRVSRRCATGHCRPTRSRSRRRRTGCGSRRR